MQPQDMYIRARNAANEAVVAQHGPKALPVKPGSEAHRHWLRIFDEAMRKELYGTSLFE